MTTSFIPADVNSEMSWSVAYKWYNYFTQAESLLIWEKLPFTLGVKGQGQKSFISGHP